MDRRSFVASASITGLTAFTAGCLGGSGDVDGEEEFPSQSFEVIVPWGPGGNADTWARQMEPHIEDATGQSVNVENIQGAATITGFTELYNREPDGYNFAFSSQPATQIADIVNEPDIALDEVRPFGGVAQAAIVVVTQSDDDTEGFQHMKEKFNSGEYSSIAAGGTGMELMPYYWDDAYDISVDNVVLMDDSAEAALTVARGESDVALVTDGATEGIETEVGLDVITAIPSYGSSVHDDVPTLPDQGFDEMDFLGGETRTHFAHPDTPDDIVEELDGIIEEAINSDTIQSWAEDAGRNAVFIGHEELASDMERIYSELPQEAIEAIKE